MLHSSKPLWLLSILGFTVFNYWFNYSFSNKPDLISALNMLPPLLSAAGAFYAARRDQGPERFFWLTIAWGAVCYFTAQFIWFYYATFTKINAPALSWADLFWILQYVLVITGLCRLLYVYNNRIRSIRFAFDAVITVLALSLLSVEFIIRPYISSRTGVESFLCLFVNVLYPVSDLVIVFCVYAVGWIVPKVFNKKQLAFITIGLMLFVLADMAYLYMQTKQTYTIGSWIDPIYNLALLFVGYSGTVASFRRQEPGKRSEERPDNIGGSFRYAGHLIPYICIAIMLGIHLTRHNEWNVLPVTGSLMIGAILIRQISVMIDYDKLVTKYKSLFIQHEFMANHDELTNLPNRRYFLMQLDRELKEAEAMGEQLAVLFMDLDRFKYINDCLGHEFGDKLIIGVSDRLNPLLMKGQTLARMGGDEFTILIPGVRDTQDVLQFAQELCAAVKLPIFVDGHEVLTATSVGIAFYPKDGTQAGELLKKADLAMYKAKESGSCCYAYTEDPGNQPGSRLDMESALERALEQQELFLLYQPQFGADDRRPMGVEALLRWKRAESVTVSPSVFIPLAEESGLIVPIGYWVIREACRQAMEWKSKGYPEWSMAVNVSVGQLNRRDFGDQVEAILKETGMSPKRLVLEISESTDMEGNAASVLQRLKMLGVRIAMDDFGDGYSSLSFLDRYKVDMLKIAQGFIREISEKPDRIDIVKAIQAMARSLRLKVVAEGVETREANELLKSIPVESVQGYYYSYPVTAEELEKRYLSPTLPPIAEASRPDAV